MATRDGDVGLIPHLPAQLQNGYARMPNLFDDDPLAGSPAPALPLRITVHPSRYYDNIDTSTNDAQGSSASTQVGAPNAATAQPTSGPAQPNSMFGADTPWWLNPSATTVQSPGLTGDDFSAETREQSPAQAKAAADVRDWLAQKIALGEAPRNGTLSCRVLRHDRRSQSD